MSYEELAESRAEVIHQRDRLRIKLDRLYRIVDVLLFHDSVWLFVGVLLGATIALVATR